jgi:hypothetical protein
MWSTADEVRLQRVEKAVKILACKIKNDEQNPTQETDPVFTASASFGITSADIATWNAAETDPIFMAAPAHFITSNDITFVQGKDYNSLNNKPNLALKADLVAGIIPVAQIPKIPPQQIITGVASYNLVPTAGLIHIYFTGTTTTLNLPPIATNLGLTILLFNGGTGDVTITANVADPNSVIDGNTGANTTILTTLTPMTIFSINNKWVTKP